MATVIEMKLCPQCKTPMTIEEQELDQCWTCGWPEQKQAPLEWDTDDDEAMPNTIQR